MRKKYTYLKNDIRKKILKLVYGRGGKISYSDMDLLDIIRKR